MRTLALVLLLTASPADELNDIGKAVDDLMARIYGAECPELLTWPNNSDGEKLYDVKCYAI